MTYEQFLDWLLEHEPDAVLSLLNISTEELLEKFDEAAYEIWQQEHADEDSQESEV